MSVATPPMSRFSVFTCTFTIRFSPLWLNSTGCVDGRSETSVLRRTGVFWFVPVAITFCKSSILKYGLSGYCTATKYWLPLFGSIQKFRVSAMRSSSR